MRINVHYSRGLDGAIAIGLQTFMTVISKLELYNAAELLQLILNLFRETFLDRVQCWNFVATGT